MPAAALRGNSLSIEIPLTHGHRALVDAEDFHLIAGYTWYHDDGYARSRTSGRLIRMHHLILPPVDGLDTDHHNGDGLDNRRVNLRYATRSQNNANRPRQRAASGFKGVHFDRRKAKFFARIGHAGGYVFLGYFDVPEDAARAYDRAALELFGEYARLNFGEHVA